MFIIIIILFFTFQQLFIMVYWLILVYKSRTMEGWTMEKCHLPWSDFMVHGVIQPFTYWNMGEEVSEKSFGFQGRTVLMLVPFPKPEIKYHNFLANLDRAFNSISCSKYTWSLALHWCTHAKVVYYAVVSTDLGFYILFRVKSGRKASSMVLLLSQCKFFLQFLFIYSCFNTRCVWPPG